nr:MAG TPA: hypothetical protein [Caudoviricetes sp.]
MRNVWRRSDCRMFWINKTRAEKAEEGQTCKS